MSHSAKNSVHLNIVGWKKKKRRAKEAAALTRAQLAARAMAASQPEHTEPAHCEPCCHTHTPAASPARNCSSSHRPTFCPARYPSSTRACPIPRLQTACGNAHRPNYAQGFCRCRLRVHPPSIATRSCWFCASCCAAGCPNRRVG